MALDTIAELGARNVLITLETGCYALPARGARGRPLPRDRRRRSSRSPRSAPGDVLLAGVPRRRARRTAARRGAPRAVAAGAASTLEVGAGRFEPREATGSPAQVEVAELEPVET